MKKQKKKKYFFRKTFFTLLLSVSLTFAFYPVHKANAWMSILAATLEVQLTFMLDQIEAALVSALKQVAATTLSQTLNNIVGGGSGGGPMFITNWQDYMVNQPEKRTQLIMNDMLTQMTRGKGSISTYASNKAFEGIGPGSFNTGLSPYGNYFSRLQAEGQRAINQAIYGGCPPITYEGNPANMKNFLDINNYLAGNDPWSRQQCASNMAQRTLAEEKRIAEAKAVAGQGFTGKEVGGMTVTPGSLVKDNLANVEDLGNKIIADADNIMGVLTAVVTKLVTKSIQNGVGNVQAQVQRQINDVTNRNLTQIQRAVGTVGPAVLYGDMPLPCGSTGTCSEGKWYPD